MKRRRIFRFTLLAAGHQEYKTDDDESDARDPNAIEPFIQNKRA